MNKDRDMWWQDIEDDVDPEERKLRDGTLTSKGRRVMDESERSRLLYLLDALRVAPQKSEKLIAVVSHCGGSEPFRKAIEDLRNSADVASASAELRESLR